MPSAARVKIKGGYTIVDLVDVHWLKSHQWNIGPNGYVMRHAPRPSGDITLLLHRVILSAPDELQVDHRDHDITNNRRSNLRLATPSQNMANGYLRADNTSGIKGVVERRGKWHAHIRRNGIKVYLGSFATPEEAARAYDAAALEHFGEFAATNEMLGLLGGVA